MASDELVSQFMAFSGSSDVDVAKNYLEMSGNNVETAVGLFMEHNAAGGGGGGAGAAAGFGAPGGDLGDIRAPDETRTMRLMDDGTGGHVAGAGGMAAMLAHDPQYRVMYEMMEEQLSRSAFAPQAAVDARRAVNEAAARGSGDDDDEAEDYKYDDDDDDENMEDDEPPAPPRLEDMFSPPTRLMHKAGGFQGARQVAKDSKRWLLVNIQKDSEFSSHALNRDVWRNDLVENLIREGFIFWQEMDVSPEGSQYVQRYHVYDFPHIAIIDPRTARLMWKKEGWTQQNPITAETFAEMAMDFCSRNSFDRPPQAPRPPGAKAPPVKEKPVYELTEDEQLQAAMRASMEDVSAPANEEGDNEVECLGTKDEMMEEDSKPPAQPSFIDELLKVVVEDEPVKGARMQLRMPDGKRVVRRFNPTDPVKIIYAFLAVRIPVKQAFTHLHIFSH
uniref:UBX domain-containing protein n=1 Tax=Amphora coffeiformis TaxID=265554 RepID=A0A7S3L3F2_9STRA